ncbi:hypothetical protein [Providencia sneebia]|uniref:Uncharacterized protein n=1 Tax=Providencia sneebia DSM 19967 TaxID=1141660 RepID=K8W6N1_9GAMM|nr:hypothetical protein [Providencia sneebia]EKT56214.1 hypothetical protein OO7_09742 [Providencia sneebia DSM 19967]
MKASNITFNDKLVISFSNLTNRNVSSKRLARILAKITKVKNKPTYKSQLISKSIFNSLNRKVNKKRKIVSTEKKMFISKAIDTMNYDKYNRNAPIMSKEAAMIVSKRNKKG